MGKKIAASLGVLILGWSLKLGWNIITAEPIDSLEDSQAEWIADQERWVADEIAAGSAAPAGKWLSQPRHGTFEGDPAKMQELIDQFQAAGAAQVWVVGIEELGKARISETIAVELPKSGYTRDRLFEIEAGFWSGEGTPDVGQDYLVISFD